MNLSLREIVLADDPEQLCLLPWGKLRILGFFLCTDETVVLSDFLGAVGHLQLEPLIDLLEVLELESVTDRWIFLRPQNVLS